MVDGRWTKVWPDSSESLSRCATNQMEQALPDMPPNKITYFRNQLRLKVNMRRSLTVIIVKGTISYQWTVTLVHFNVQLGIKKAVSLIIVALVIA